MTGHTWLTTQAEHGDPPLWALTDYEITRATRTAAGKELAALQTEQESRRQLRAAIRPTTADHD